MSEYHNEKDTDTSASKEVDRQVTRISSEDKCLLVDEMTDEQFYARLSPSRKRIIVFIVSISCLVSPLSSLAFLPAISEIAAQFDTSATVINISSAAYCVVMAVSPCLMGPLGDIYGRRVIFLTCLTFYTATSVCVAVSQNLSMFFVFRCLTALSGTAFFATGSSVIGDIYPPTDRGNAMGWVLSGSQLGPAFGPCLGGIIVNFASWRVIFWVLAGMGLFVLIMAFCFLVETGRFLKYKQLASNSNSKFVFVPYNPFRVVVALKHFSLMLAGMISVSLHYNMYALLTPIRYVMNPRFKLEEPLYAGLFYLAPGVGYLVGSFMGGRWADYHVRKYIQKRGRRVPEDRLRSAVIAHGLALPGSILIYGWTLDKEKGGMVIPVICMFVCGVAQTICFPSVNTYCVDSMPHLKGDAIASNYMIRFLAAAVASATILTQIKHIGIGWTCTISAFILWLGFLSNALLIVFGERLRGEDPKRNTEIEFQSQSKY